MSHKIVTSKAMREQGWMLCAEAARRTGITVQTLYRWIDAEPAKAKGASDGYRRYIWWDDVKNRLGPEVVASMKL